ncbi:MAG: cell division topological specificity factor MinE [Alphaproteobacteria bacterium]|nr:cell division topological specificity factor MinE [Alphaproteobacteria bacterium]
MINRIFGRSGSKEDAKSRLKLLLVHDQVDLTPAQLESMKAEIVEVIARYVEVDRDAVDFKLEKTSGEIALVSNVPVRRVTARAV